MPHQSATFAHLLQLFLILPFITKLFSVNRKRGWTVLIFLILGSLFLRGALNLDYHLKGCLGSTSKEAALDQARDQTVTYNKPYTRAIPYLFGIGLAFFYSEKGGAKNTQKITISRPVMAFAWFLVALIMGLCVFGTYKMRSTDAEDMGTCTWNSYQDFFSMTFGTTGWSVAITFIIFTGLFGYGGLVTDLLAANIFCPLSRLVYGAYLVHPMLMYALYYSGSEEVDWYGYRIWIDFLGLAVFSFVVSFIGHIVVEKPLNNVQKIILPAGR